MEGSALYCKLVVKRSKQPTKQIIMSERRRVSRSLIGEGGEEKKKTLST